MKKNTNQCMNSQITATDNEWQAIKEFEDNYEGNSKIINVNDFKERTSNLLESGRVVDVNLQTQQLRNN